MNLTRKQVEQMTEAGREVMAANAGTHESVLKSWETRHAGFPATDAHGTEFGGLTKAQAIEHAKAHDLAMHASKTPEEFNAHKLSRDASFASENAFHGANTPEEESLHLKAADANRAAGRAQRANGNWQAAHRHENAAAGHETVASNLAWMKAGKPSLHWDSSD